MATTGSSTAPVPTAPNASMTEGKAAQDKDLIHMRALRPSDELPPHASLSNETTSKTSLQSFAAESLNQGSAFLDKELSEGGHFKPKGKEKPAGISKGKVQVYSFDRPGGSYGKNEAWFARVSKHDGKREKGSAEFGEFDFGLREEHSLHEKDYTPDVFDAYCVVDYGNVGAVEGWENVEVKVMEMCHKIPPPLSNRVFAVVVVTGKKPNNGGLIVVQIPVDLSKVQAARYSNGANKKDKELKGEQKKGVVVGEYVSIERCRVEQPEGTVVWEMATASDAKGWLPMALQKPALPGKITLDVGLFMDWIEKHRTKGAATTNGK